MTEDNYRIWKLLFNCHLPQRPMSLKFYEQMKPEVFDVFRVYRKKPVTLSWLITGKINVKKVAS